MYSKTETDLIYKGDWVCSITTGMHSGDESLMSINLADRGLLVKKLITLEPHSIF